MNSTELDDIIAYHYTDVSGATIGVHMNLIGDAPEQLRILLSRALNTIPPHDPQWKDWFELADALDKAAANSATAG